MKGYFSFLEKKIRKSMYISKKKPKINGKFQNRNIDKRKKTNTIALTLNKKSPDSKKKDQSKRSTYC